MASKKLPPLPLEEQNNLPKIYWVNGRSTSFQGYADSYRTDTPEECFSKTKGERKCCCSAVEAKYQVFLQWIKENKTKVRMQNFKGEKFLVVGNIYDDDFPLTRAEISKRTGFDLFGIIHNMEEFELVFNQFAMWVRINGIAYNQGEWLPEEWKAKEAKHPYWFSSCKLYAMKQEVLANKWHLAFEPQAEKAPASKGKAPAKEFVLLTHKCPQCNAELKVEGTLASCSYCNSKFTVAERSLFGR